jgi:ADP-ribose pyrophosphatase YjhB (NUDIX family)
MTSRIRYRALAIAQVFYNNPLPVVAAVVEHDDGLGRSDSRGVILVRGKGWPAGWHGLVTGFLEAREDPAVGVLREVKEELGLEGTIEGTMLGAYAFARLNQLILAFHVRVPTGPLHVTLQTEELEGWKKVPLSQLRPWSEGTGAAVRDFLIRTTGSSPPMSDENFKRPPRRKASEAVAAMAAGAATSASGDAAAPSSSGAAASSIVSKL